MKRILIVILLLFIHYSCLLKAHSLIEDIDSSGYVVLFDYQGDNYAFKHFAYACNEVLNLGGTVKEHVTPNLYTSESLSDVDIVFICLRKRNLLAEEIDILEQHVRSGGSLLITYENTRNSATVLDLAGKFGIEITDDYFADGSLIVLEDGIVYPVTNAMRDVNSCQLFKPSELLVSENSVGLLNSNNGASPGTPGTAYMVLSKDCGKGRVIVVGDASLWCDDGCPD